VSPIQAMERSYGRLREMLRVGAFAPGARLEANRLADELAVSMTPIRDALHRLVGERLVDASSGEGFHAPRLSEAELRELYEWNAAILSIAIRTTPAATLARAIGEISTGSLADRTAELCARIASAVPNAELARAIIMASDRLHPFRMREPEILPVIDDEFDNIARVGPAQVQAIRRFHMRRMRATAELVRCRDNQSSAPRL
jgi:DNA-binding GntR family transcriptional regulator